MTSSIANIDMDFYGCARDGIATRGVGPCICFVIVLDDGREVFLEHRSDIFFSSELVLENVSLCFQNLAEHISEVLPSSTIMVALIVGGYDLQERFVTLKSLINQLIQLDIKDTDDDDLSPHYSQLLNNIKFYNVCFNLELKLKNLDIVTIVDVIVDKYSNNERAVIINQYMQISGGSHILVGVFAIELKSDKRTFTMNQVEINKHQNQTSDQDELVMKVVEHFQSCVETLDATKLVDNFALELLHYSRRLSDQIDKKFYAYQKELTSDDQEMCRVEPTDNEYNDDDDMNDS